MRQWDSILFPILQLLQERFQKLFEKLSEDASKESLTDFFKQNKDRQTIAEVKEAKNRNKTSSTSTQYTFHEWTTYMEVGKIYT